jgi:hypothetical protein
VKIRSGGSKGFCLKENVRTVERAAAQELVAAIAAHALVAAIAAHALVAAITAKAGISWVLLNLTFDRLISNGKSTLAESISMY